MQDGKSTEKADQQGPNSHEPTELLCSQCLQVNVDPGGDPDDYVCGRCDGEPLIRKPSSLLPRFLVSASLGAVAGTAVAGIHGALYGLLCGLIIAYWASEPE